MTMETIIVVGFDLRRPIADQNSNWSEERRSQFLIRPETPSPISVDAGVWPVFAGNPDGTYPMQLWGSVSEILEAYPDAARTENSSPIIIEIALITTEKESLRHWEGMLETRVKPEKGGAFEISAECLGYDVADRYFVSGLSNCMLSQKELAGIRKDWTNAINGWGLFDEAEAAESFKTICDQLIPEHAPFEAFRMRTIQITRTI